ncbi:hypothetical protein ASPVEDRAFT_196671 [Aspergillus versicolor CBS 583.65]|uniref:Citrate exporter 1 n=1 Tax=Aspergillus versicolor CBS 583.65 TaxID=1036611 RepID=A0A1L9PS39_ASPVE|nr:uncharacterized protein ASPVEDRAFT_196671 [Aspergillus versicolor CBS 583.65]OJJ04350.1 hypothetical protein ASPVEDRAFT_196671 [Aspergillus versicolor CBS 583.65]
MDDHPTETAALLQRPSPPSKSNLTFTPSQKRLIILAASLASAFSPLSSNIYYPALNSLASDLNVTPSQINLTITTYMICQSLSPTLTATLSDTSGRRPAYILCFTLYIVSNISLAFCKTYPSLLALRALQSTGISGTVALSAAVAADIITPDERGKYMGFTSLGNILAPSLGPILGGALSESRFGWRGIFWFLALSGGVVLLGLVGWFPETKADATRQRAEAIAEEEQEGGAGGKKWRHILAFPNPFNSLRMLFHLPTGLILLSNGLVFASYYAVTAGIPTQSKRIYGLSDMGIGLVFLPAGLGSLLSAVFNGVVVDWNYRRKANQFLQRVTNMSDNSDTDTNRQEFPTERARLQIGAPMTFLCSLAILAYGFTLDLHPPLFVSLILIILISFSVTASYNVMNVLLVDLYYSTPATVMAANNFVRCFLGAASTALVAPMIERFNNGKTYAFVSGIIGGICCPILGIVYSNAVKWRSCRGTIISEPR